MSALQSAYDHALKQADAHTAIAADDALLAKKAGGVSHWNVAQHLEHMALANLGIFQRINEALAATPENSRGRVSLQGCVVLWTGKIPRGRAKAPELTVPQVVSFDAMRAKVSEGRAALIALGTKLPVVEASRGRSPHPVLGMFTAAHWLRFIPIHNRHHDNIIREIRNA